MWKLKPSIVDQVSVRGLKEQNSPLGRDINKSMRSELRQQQDLSHELSNSNANQIVLPRIKPALENQFDQKGPVSPNNKSQMNQTLIGINKLVNINDGSSDISKFRNKQGFYQTTIAGFNSQKQTLEQQINQGSNSVFQKNQSIQAGAKNGFFDTMINFNQNSDFIHTPVNKMKNINSQTSQRFKNNSKLYGKIYFQNDRTFSVDEHSQTINVASKLNYSNNGLQKLNQLARIKNQIRNCKTQLRKEQYDSSPNMNNMRQRNMLNIDSNQTSIAYIPQTEQPSTIDLKKLSTISLEADDYIQKDDYKQKGSSERLGYLDFNLMKMKSNFHIGLQKKSRSKIKPASKTIDTESFFMHEEFQKVINQISPKAEKISQDYQPFNNQHKDFHIIEERKNLLTPHTHAKVKHTCRMIDEMIQQKKDLKEKQRRAFQLNDQKLLKDTEETEEEEEFKVSEHKKTKSMMQNLVQSLKIQVKQQETIIKRKALEPLIKEKYRKRLEFQQTKDKLTKMLDNIKKNPQQVGESEGFQTKKQIGDFTRNFLSDMLSSVQAESKKAQQIQELQDQIKQLKKDQDKYELSLKNKLISLKQKAGLISDTKARLKKEMTKQLAINLKTDPKQKEQPARYISLKNRGRFRQLVQKHFLNKKDNKLNLTFLAKVINMQDKLEQIFIENQNLGQKYRDRGQNIWSNSFFNNVYMKVLTDNKIELHKTLEASESMNVLKNFDLLFEEQVQKLKFYKQAKAQKVLDENDKDALVSQKYLEECQRLHEIPVPSFARIKQNQLFLSEIIISDSMAEAMKLFLEANKDRSLRCLYKVFIDDCGMTNKQFSTILEGLLSQKGKLQTLVYSNGDFGESSCGLIVELMPFLRELQINKIVRGGQQSLYNRIMTSVLDNGLILQKLKLSNTNLNSNSSIDLICKIIKTKPFVQHLDLSWSKLPPKGLFKISNELMENPNILKSLNLGYNSLSFNPQNEELLINSEEFVYNMVEYIQASEMLNHLDISGMNFIKEYMIQLCQAIASSELLLSVHLSDNNISTEMDYTLEILDIFGLNESIYKDIPCKINRGVLDGENLRKIVNKTCGTFNNQQQIDPKQYQKHIVKTKQGKSVGNNKLMNQTQTAQGIGRMESSLVDLFVLSRQINQPELVFNQQKFIDLYFEDDAGEKWQFSHKGHCYVCNKHKFLMVFLDRKSPIKGMKEITDEKVIDEIKANLNINYNDNDVAPFVCGSIVNGGFSRKLKMLRGDLYSILAVCQSANFITSWKQSRAIRKGIEQFYLSSQDIKMQDSLDIFKGWESVMKDYVLKNQINDITTVNFPQRIGEFVETWTSKGFKKPDPECTTFVYAAYVPPGLHQFIIYDPITKKAYAKDMIIDLNSQDFHPEYPSPLKILGEKKKKKTRSNVWRKWREDTEEHHTQAFFTDIAGGFDLSLFIKEEEDIELCTNILFEYFPIIKIVFIELIALSHITYPEIQSSVYIDRLMAQQSPQMNKVLPQSQIELCVIRATRGDAEQRLGGKLCRGEFMESLIRCCASSGDRKGINLRLRQFLDSYIVSQFNQSSILKIRKEIRASKPLNQLLYDNAKGLRMLHKENKIPNKGFTIESAIQFFNKLSGKPNAPFVKNLTHCFVACQMTNLEDNDQPQTYLSLVYVEFLEMLCRVSIQYWVEQNEISYNRYAPTSVEDRVFSILEMIWAQREKKKIKKAEEKKGKKVRKRRKKDEFPELVEIQGDEDDDE